MSSGNKLGKRAYSASLLTIVYSTVIASFSGTSLAQVIGFMPGDSYFRVNLSKTVTGSLPRDGGDLEFTYAHTTCLCGFAGFYRIRIEGVTGRKVREIQAAFDLMRRYRRPGTPTDVTELPKLAPSLTVSVPSGKNSDSGEAPAGGAYSAPRFNLFVYSAKCDWHVHSIGFKYNANWAHLPAAALGDGKRQKDAGKGFFGETLPARAEGVYDPLIATYDGVLEDWKGCTEFPSLEIKTPQNTAWGLIRDEPIMTPVTVKAGDVQFVVTSNDFLSYFKKEEGARFYAISESGLYQMSWVRLSNVPELQGKNIDD